MQLQDIESQQYPPIETQREKKDKFIAGLRDALSKLDSISYFFTPQKLLESRYDKPVVDRMIDRFKSLHISLLKELTFAQNTDGDVLYQKAFADVSEMTRLFTSLKFDIDLRPSELAKSIKDKLLDLEIALLELGLSCRC